MKKPDENFIMLPTVDFCFKELMMNPKVRTGFIAALLNLSPDEIQDTEIVPTELPRDYPEDKLGILDVHVRMRDGRHLNLEMQVQFFEYWDSRILFYLSKMFSGQLKKGDSYEKLRKCIHVSILDFSWFDDDLYYHTIHLYDDGTKERYSDLLELQFLELKKLPPEAQSEKGILRWMRFLHGKSRKEFEHMAGTDEYIQEAYDTLVQMSADEKKQMEYEAREKALRDYQSQMKSAENAGFRKGERTGFQKGEQAGFQKGEQSGLEKAKRIFQLNAQGKTITEIADICQMTEPEVRDILD